VLLEYFVYRGDHHVLHQRLKNHLHRTIIDAEEDCPAEASRPVNPLNLDYLIIIDFEATCRENCPDDWLYEIIEFPAILLNVQTLKVVGFAGICYVDTGVAMCRALNSIHSDMCYHACVHVCYMLTRLKC